MRKLQLGKNSAKSLDPIWRSSARRWPLKLPSPKYAPFSARPWFWSQDCLIGLATRSFGERVTSSIFSLRRSSTKTSQALAIRPKWITMADIAAIVLKSVAVISFLSKNAKAPYYYQHFFNGLIEFGKKVFIHRQNTDLFIDTRPTPFGAGKAVTKRGLEEDHD